MLETLFGRPGKLANNSTDPVHGRADNWYEMIRTGGGRKTLAGTHVNEDLALTYSAVWCATRCICEPGSGLPLLTYERTNSGEDRQQARDFSLYQILKDAPNDEMDSTTWREGRSAHQVNWGNAFSEIERADPLDPESEIVNLWPIHPSRVRPTTGNETDRRGRALDPSFRYIVTGDDGEQTAFRASEMLHVPGVISEDGIWGKGMIAYARESIGGALAVHRHGYAYFGSGAQPKGVINTPGMKDKDARKAFRAEWKQFHGSPDSNEIAILGMESKYTPITISNEDSQFLGSREFDVREVARWYRIPPHMLADIISAGYGSVEQMALEFVMYSLMPWLRKWEGQMNLKLLTREQRQTYFIEHQLNGLLRGDFTARMNGYQVALMNGVMTINECRRLENLNSIGPDGDKTRVTRNIGSLESVDQATPISNPKTQPDAQATVEQMGRELGIAPATKMVAVDNKRVPEQAKGERIALEFAARQVLLDALSRMFTKESNAMERATRGADFPARMDEFYSKYESTLAEALTPACSVLDAAGLEISAIALAARITAESQTELVRAYNHDTRTQLAERLASWPTERAQQTATRILQGEYTHA